ncbi:hypothetical protein FDZ74_12075 [bacterium]|nr:MAG: hypothetical protein FDZ74_12075 [bacterium]
MRVKIWMVLLAIALAAGAQAATPVAEGQLAVPHPTAAEVTQEPATVEAHDATPLPEPTQPCGYQWAHQDLPEVSAQFQQAFDAAGLTDVTVRADAFGENCLNSDGSVQRFLTRQTDLYIQIQSADLSAETLGGWLEQILAIIGQIPAENLPGPMSASASLGFEFTSGEATKNLWLERPQAFAALEDGKRGVELYQALAP